MKLVTQPSLQSSGGVVRYVAQQNQEFNENCFDVQSLKDNGWLDGVAAAGRGNTVFFTQHDQQLVLRHYKRGGLVQRLSKDRYLYTGMGSTRAFREFDILLQLQEKGLPASRPYACRVLRQGLFYSASLITHKIEGHTLAERMTASDEVLSDEDWRGIGHVIAAFHSAGVYHADLNAHNIMIDSDGGVALIDFDRSTVRALPASPAQSGWCLDNLNRLERSIRKVMGDQVSGFAGCKQAWARLITQGNQ